MGQNTGARPKCSQLHSKTEQRQKLGLKRSYTTSSAQPVRKRPRLPKIASFLKEKAPEPDSRLTGVSQLSMYEASQFWMMD